MADAAIAAMTEALLRQNQPFYRIWQTNPLTGESSQDITEWFQYFEYHASLVSNVTNAEKLTELKKSLNGRALSVFLSAPVAEVNTYDSAKQFLKTNLAPINQRALWQQEFQTRTKQESETVADYLRDLKRLVNLAFENEQDNAKKLVLKQKFISGLMVDNQSHQNYKLWKTAYKNMNDTLDNIVAAVITAESHQRLFATETSSRKDHEDIQAAMSSCRSTYQSRNQYSRWIQSPDQCKYCGFPGHDVTDCRFLKAAKQHAQYGSNANRCSHCAKPGHFRQDCWLYAQAKGRLGGREPVTCSTHQDNQKVRFQQPYKRHQQRPIPVQAADIDFLGGEFMMHEDDDFNYPAYTTTETSSIPVDDLTPRTERKDPHRRQWKRKRSKNKQETRNHPFSKAKNVNNNTESFQQPRQTVRRNTRKRNGSSQESFETVPMDNNKKLEANKNKKHQSSRNRPRRKQRPRTQPDTTNARVHSTVESAVEKNVKSPQKTILTNIGTAIWSIIQVVFSIICAPIIKVMAVFSRSSGRASPCVEFVIKNNSIQVRAQDGSRVSIVKRSRNRCVVRIWSNLSDSRSSMEATDPLIKTRQVPSKGKPGWFNVPRQTGRRSTPTAPAATSPVQSGDAQLDLSPPVVSPGSWSLFPFSSLWSSGGSWLPSPLEETPNTSSKTPTDSSPATPEMDENLNDQPPLETNDVQEQRMDPSTMNQDATDQEEQLNGSKQEQVDKDFFCEDFDYPDVLIIDQPVTDVQSPTSSMVQCTVQPHHCQQNKASHASQDGQRMPRSIGTIDTGVCDGSSQ